MKTTQIFPLILIMLDIGASIVYMAHGDLRKFIYWLAAATLSITVKIPINNGTTKRGINILSIKCELCSRNAKIIIVTTKRNINGMK